MAKSTFGRGVALQGTFNKADALWANDYNRKANIVAAEKKQRDLENQKAADYINKTLNTANAGLHRIYQDKAREKTSEYLNQYYSGLKQKENYTQSEENVRAFQDLISFLDNAKQSTENIKTTAAFKMQHPNDLEIDPTVNNVLEKGGYDDFVKIKGNDFFDTGYGTLAKPNLEEAKKFVNTGIYEGVMPRTDIKRDKGMIVSNNIVDPNMNVYKENVYISYQDPVTKGYYENRGGIEQYEKDLGTPQPKIFGTQVAKESGKGSTFSFGIETNPTGNVAIEQVKNPDGSVDYAWTGTGLTTETNQVVIPTRYSTAVGDKNKVTEGYVIKGVRLKYFPEQNAVQFHGQYYDLKGRPIEIKDNQKIMYDLDNLNDEQVKILKNVSANTNNTLSFANGKPEVVGGKTSMLREYKVYDNKGKEAPAKTTQPKAAKYPLPKGKPATVKQGAYTYTWNEQTGQYE